MEEDSNTGAVQDLDQVQMESVSPQSEANQDQSNSEVQASSQQVSADPQDKSWIRKVRRDRDDAIRKAEEAERKALIQEQLIKQLMANQGNGQSSASEEEDILDQIGREEYVPGDKVVKALRKQQEDFDRKLGEFKKVQDRNIYASQEAELKSKYADYDDVVNPDTLDTLKETNPKLFNRVANLLKVDPMDGAVFAYETIMSAGVVDKVPDLRRSKEVDKKLEQNKKTVQSPTSFEKRPMAQAMNYPESRKAKEALWNETLNYANMGGGGY